MKKTLVIGLGIIGGSICAALTKAGYFVDGADLDEQTLALAKEKGYIQNAAKDFSVYDTVFIAVPLKATCSILETGRFKKGALVADICGVKSEIERLVYKTPRDYRYVGLHPMAGKETSGLSSASSELFNSANLIITLSENTEKSALAEIKEYAKAMRFGRIVECSAEEHDQKIAITSQLAHIVSNAYVKSPQVKDCKGFTGGSFQDMTRIAGVDEEMWTQLYLGNKTYVLDELDGLIDRLIIYRDAIKNEDETGLKAALKEGKRIRQSIKYTKK